jgi:two-component system sensor histidine kinase KdpD
VWLDGALFSQLIDNLLQNAVRHSQSMAPIHVGARHVGESIEIIVKDSGVGFSEGVLKAFRELRGNDFSGTDGSPLGLGLSICNAIAKAHSADLRLENWHGPTSGGIAKILIPMASAAHAPV